MHDILKFSVKPGESLLDALRNRGAYVPSPCGGKGICGKCTVEVAEAGTVRACSHYPEGEVTVKLRQPSPMQVLTESFWPDPEPQPDFTDAGEQAFLALAVDLGTTTVAVFLDDLRSHRNLGVRTFPNPQQPYGADVISRINYCREESGGTGRLQSLITGAIGDAALYLCALAGFSPEQVGRMSVAGNPTMLHLFRGINPESLALYPFTPVFLDEQRLDGTSAGFSRFPNLVVEMLPSVSSYVGADIVAGLAAVSVNPPEGWSLFLDIGTNGEMALWKEDAILACATAAGPAFEGARISCGMAGVEGAVSGLRKDGCETIGNKPPAGLCGSGLVDAVALLLDEGSVDIMGYLAEDAPLQDTGLSLTPQDIREVQLAKGAIAAGIRVLMSEAGITASEIRQVFMAGGFGYALHDWSAGRIGLIPDGLEKKQIRAGNTSGLGARLWLHSAQFRDYARGLAGRVRYVELSDHAEFNDLFMWEMMFPEK
jgi:uncharacterized 2Fe-2S/4Fe-4S cluster protein (DUF4445 family)